MALDTAQIAHAAQLRYVSDAEPGFTRERHGAGFRYRDIHGEIIYNEDILERIRRLAIPPAWADVWIAPHSAGHMQATGRDAKGRKQYRYHAQWCSVRDEVKFGLLVQFGAALPELRRQVNAHLALRTLCREKVLAVVVRLLETTYIRVGNEEYARTNGSFGLTTFRNKHVDVANHGVRFKFTGKSGKSHTISLSSRRLARAVKRIRDLPGQQLFQYEDENGEPRAIDSSDVNGYIREIAGEEFTAKVFRTWAGSVLASAGLAALDNDNSSAAYGRAAQAASIKAVSALLGNTPSVCRTKYVHPRVIEAYVNADVRAEWAEAKKHSRESATLTRVERTLLKFLESGSADPSG